MEWQTAFFGLVQLALNAMTQPSSLDFNLPESSLLFMARSSPFICVADALEVIIALCVYAYQEGSIFEAARLVNWRIARARLGNEVSGLEASAVEKHPWTFIILFLATLVPAIKLLGLHGLPWTKVWTNMYLCSFVVLAIVRALAPKGWRNTPPPQFARLAEVPSFHEQLLGISRIVLWVVASAVHATVACWALTHVQHEYDDEGGLFLTARLIFFLTTSGLLVLSISLLLHFHFMGTDRSEILLYFLTLPMAGQRNAAIAWYPLFLKLEPHIFILPITAGAFCVAYALKAQLEDTSVTILTIFSAGGFSLTMCFGLLFLLFTIMSVIFESVPFLSFLKFNDGNYKALLVFPFFNFLVAFLYYCFVYDPTGTAKPSWTENLG